MMRARVLLSIAGIFLCGWKSPALADSVDLPDRIETDIEEYLEAFAEVRGLDGSILIAVGDRILIHEGYGLANREWNVPNRPDTRFLIASVTKPFTAMATLQLAEQGHIQLDEPIATYLSPYRADSAEKVTVHDLLAHTSGIPNFATREFYVGESARLDYERWEFIDRHCSGDLLFEPGTQSQYSDANYILLATLLERVTGETFGELLERLIFRPAGMTQSSVVTRYDTVEGLASSYLTDEGAPQRPYFINYADVQRGAGDMISSTTDLFRWVRGLRNGSLLGTHSVDLMFHPHAISGFDDLMQGYGWNLSSDERPTDEGQPSFAHAPGNNGGYNAVLYLLPEIDGTIVILLNTGTPWLDNRLFELSEAIAGALVGEKLTPPSPSIVPVLRAALSAQADLDVPTFYGSLRRTGLYSHDERGLNVLGYEQLRVQRTGQAIDLFRINVEEAPQSANTYDSLGEAYWSASEWELSLQNYRRSLELNPGNENAQRMIGEVESKLEKSTQSR